MIKKLFVLLVLGQFYSASSQVIEKFESDMSSINSPSTTQMRNLKCKEEIAIPIDYSVENISYGNDNVSWPPFGDGTYEVQLIEDYACCGHPNYPSSNLVITYYINTNGFNSIEASSQFNNSLPGNNNPKCFRWRIKLKEDCTYSEWCCLSITSYPDVNDCKARIEDFSTNSAKPGAKAYPNPTSDFVIIENSDAKVFITYNTEGQQVKMNSFSESSTEKKIDFKNFKPGIYIIKSEFGEEFKIIKE